MVSGATYESRSLVSEFRWEWTIMVKHIPILAPYNLALAEIVGAGARPVEIS